MKTPRTFRLSDALVLIAATAVGLAMVRAYATLILWIPIFLGSSSGRGTASEWAPIIGFGHALTAVGMIDMAVFLSWTILALSGRWRAEPSWIDRAGRVLGVFWIATIPLAGWWDFHAWS